VSTALLLVVIGVLHDYVDWFNYFRMTCSSNPTVIGRWRSASCRHSHLHRSHVHGSLEYST